MRLDKLTIKSREALADADSLARREGHQEVNTLHVLASLLAQDDGVVRPILERAGVRVDMIQQKIVEALEKLPKVQGADTYLGKELKKLLDEAYVYASALKDEFVSTEHFLLAIADGKGGEASKLFKRNGIALDTLRAAMMDVRGEPARGGPGSRREVPSSRAVLPGFESARHDGQVRSRHRTRY